MTDEPVHQHVQSYADAIDQYRERKDDYFRNGAGSPIPEGDRASFVGIPYYPVDEALVFEGLALEPYPTTDEAFFEIETTDGRRRRAERAGRFRFDLAGDEQVLTAYGAGRYLDVEAEDDGTWTLDFNLAYHPSCVYDARFSCPITPAENRLRARVRAGERLGPDGH
jgi:uncharacterized protein (DUF1684 family)